MKDRTQELISALHKAGKRASQQYSDAEKAVAFENGKNSANSCIEKGTPISLLDEGQVFLSELELAERMGWNSQVFSDANKALRESKTR